MSAPLSDSEVVAALQKLPGWTREGDALARTFSHRSFRDAMSFMVRVAFEAEELNHHPDWTNVYGRVSVRLSTHDAGGRITARDVELAGRIDRQYRPN